MTQQKTMSRAVIDVAREVASGLRPAGDLLTSIDALSGASVDAAAQFERDAVGNPEIDEASVQRVREAFALVASSLDAMRVAVESDDPIGVSIAADGLERATLTIREAQEAYFSRLQADALTPWPYLNRMFVHLEHAITGSAEISHARVLLEARGDLIDQLRSYAACVRESPEGRARADAAVAEIDEALTTMRAALDAPAVERSAVLVAVKSRLTEAALELCAVLEAHVVHDLSAGPTPLIHVNLAILAAERFVAGESEEAAFVEVVSRCRNAVAEQLPLGADLALRQAAHAVQQQLDLLVTSRASLDAARVAEASAMLENASRTLAMYLSMAAQPDYDEEDSVFDFVSGSESSVTLDAGAMPRMLSTLLALCEQYAAGEVTREKLLRNIGRLEGTVARFAGQAAPRPNESAAMPGMRAAIALLGDATGSLRAFADTGDRRALEVAASLMREATEALK